MKEKKETAESMQDSVTKEIPVSYTKQQILNAEKYRGQRDMLDALLSEDMKYTVAEVEQVMDKFMKGKVI